MSPLRKDLRAICADGAASSVMVGIGETYLPAFVLVLTASQLACGLVATVPMVAGALMQLASPYLVGRLHSYRLWVVLCATIQAAAFLPLFAAAVVGSMPAALVFVVATVYWGAGLATGPAWNVWVGTLVPRRLRARFFARRTLISQSGILAGFVAGGVALQWGTHLGTPVTVFALLFLTAAGSRLVSARFLATQREPLPPVEGIPALGMGRLLGSLRSDAHPRALLYMLGMQMAVQIAGPYFTPYIFVQLKLSYLGYVVLICSAYAAKIVTLPLVGRLVQRLGPNRVLWIGGLGVTPLPALWLVCDSFGFLVLLQVICGIVWGAYELAMLLVFFESIPSEKRVGILTIFNLANATAFLAGSLLGGAALAAFGAGRAAYVVLFAGSSIARGAALLLLVRMPRVTLRSLLVATRPIALRPSVGSVDRPVLPGLDPPITYARGQLVTLTSEQPSASASRSSAATASRSNPP